MWQHDWDPTHFSHCLWKEGGRIYNGSPPSPSDHDSLDGDDSNDNKCRRSSNANGVNGRPLDKVKYIPHY